MVRVIVCLLSFVDATNSFRKAYSDDDETSFVVTRTEYTEASKDIGHLGERQSHSSSRSSNYFERQIGSSDGPFSTTLIYKVYRRRRCLPL